MTTEQLLNELGKYISKYSDESEARNQDRPTIAQDRVIIASLNSRLGELISEERKKLRDQKFALELSKGLRYKKYRTEGFSAADAKEYRNLDLHDDEQVIVDLVSCVHRLETLQGSIQELLNALSSQLRVLGADFRNNTY